MANSIEELLRTDSDIKIESQNEEASKLISTQKRKLKYICRNLCLDADIYDPSKSMSAIADYLKTEPKLERVLYSEMSSGFGV